MDLAKLIGIIKALLPTKKVAVYLVAVAVAALAMFLKMSETELKDSYCKDNVIITK